MADKQSYLPVVSLHLSRTLEEIGLNKCIVSRRRHAHLYSEKVLTLKTYLAGLESSVFHFGSQTEGTTTPGLYSDLDTLTCDLSHTVIEQWSEWKQGQPSLLMLLENTAPGYCRLQLLRSDVPMAKEGLPGEHYTHDDKGSVLMKNSMLTRDISDDSTFTINGPARSSSKPGNMDRDFVGALHCSSWPKQAEGFALRRRRYHWPTQRVLQEAISHGCFLVPVGHKLSPTSHLEWRISASLSERYLMLSLSLVHLKCYVLLKMLIQTFVDPCTTKCISSYHCKTALLFCTENTEPGFWRDDNLIECVQRCLLTLRTWVADGFCPQFFITEANLFDGKVNAQKKGLIQSVLTTLIQSNGRALLQVHIDDMGHTLHSKLSTKPSVEPVLESITTMKLVGRFAFYFQACLYKEIENMQAKEASTDPGSLLCSVNQKFQMLRDRCIDQSNELERCAIQAFLESLSCWRGSVMASIALSRKRRIPREAIQAFRTATRSDIASLLKLASVFYCDEKYDKAETILQKLETHFSKHEIQPVCVCYDKQVLTAVEFCHVMYLLKGKRARAKMSAQCVRFSPQEIHCVPPELQKEFARSSVNDLQQGECGHENWMDLAVADCQPYLHYLQYITYGRLGRVELQQRALRNLRRCFKEDNTFSHVDTAWNLLGQCMEMEQCPGFARTCYRTSLEIRPRNNAANWYLQNVCNDKMKKN